MTVTTCAPMSSVTALAAENDSAEETESVVAAENASEGETEDMVAAESATDDVAAAENASEGATEDIMTKVAGGEAYFKFVPETEGDYTIYSYDNGDLDPVGTLYDSSLNEIDASEASPKARPTMSESAATRPSPGRPTTRPGACPER